MTELENPVDSPSEINNPEKAESIPCLTEPTEITEASPSIDGDKPMEDIVDTDREKNSENEHDKADSNNASKDLEVEYISPKSPLFSKEMESVQDKITAGFDVINQKLSDLDKAFASKISNSEHDGKIIDSMHRELQEYKSDLYSKILKPVLMDIIEVRDSIVRMTAAYLQKPEGEQSIPNKVFAGYALDLQDILERYGIEIYKGEICTPYVPIKQKVLKKIVTSDEKLEGTIAESMSYGYLYNDKVLVPEKVSIYSYQKPESVEQCEKNNLEN